MSLEALFSLKPFLCQRTLFSSGHILRGRLSSGQVKLGWRLDVKQLWSPQPSQHKTKMTGRGVFAALYSTKCAGKKTLRAVKMLTNLGSHIHQSPNNTCPGSVPLPHRVSPRPWESHFSLAGYAESGSVWRCSFIILLPAPIKYLFFTLAACCAPPPHPPPPTTQVIHSTLIKSASLTFVHFLQDMTLIRCVYEYPPIKCLSVHRSQSLPPSPSTVVNLHFYLPPDFWVMVQTVYSSSFQTIDKVVKLFFTRREQQWVVGSILMSLMCLSVFLCYTVGLYQLYLGVHHILVHRVFWR